MFDNQNQIRLQGTRVTLRNAVTRHADDKLYEYACENNRADAAAETGDARLRLFGE